MLVQAAGGNTSAKVDDVIYVKSSGTRLRDANTRDIFARLNLSHVRRLLAQRQEDFTAAAHEGSLRPSIETSLHALLPHRVVLHVHSINTIVWTLVGGGDEEILRRLRGLQVILVDYARPGLPLTLVIEKAIGAADDKVPLILVLKNHGLVVAADAVAEASDVLLQVERALVRPKLQSTVEPKLAALETAPEAPAMRVPSDPEIHTLACDPACLEFAKRGALYPDHVVFLGPEPIIVPDGQPLSAFLSEQKSIPQYVIVPGRGVLIAKDAKESVEEMLLAWASTVVRLKPTETVTPLAAGEIGCLLDWDAEKFRKSMEE